MTLQLDRTPDQLEKTLLLVNDRMLNLKNTAISETCPIGIVDFSLWEWPQGIGLYGMYQYYRTTGKADCLARLTAWYEARFREGVPRRNVNTTAPMLTLAFLAEETGNAEWRAFCHEWAEWVLHKMPRTEEGGLQHIVSGGENPQQLWDDTLFMTVLFLAKMGELENNDAYREEAAYQFLLHAKYLCDKKTGLWYHGWSFIGRHNFAKALWARGNCWITAGIPEYLSIANPPDSIRRVLCGLLVRQAETLCKLQAESGLWHTLLDDPNSYEEASATAGFAYGLLKGIHRGLLPAGCLSAAQKAVEGVLSCIDADGTVGQVSYGTGMGKNLRHYRDIPLCPMAYGQSLTVMMLCEAMH